MDQDITNDPSMMRGALLWLRNHYDVGTRGTTKEEVIKAIDLVLRDNVSVADMQRFRRWLKKHQ